MTRRTLAAGAVIAMLVASHLAIEANAATKAPTDGGGWGPRDSWDSQFTDGNIFDDYDHGGIDWIHNGDESPKSRWADCPDPKWRPGMSDAAWQQQVRIARAKCKRAETPKESPRPKPKPPTFEKPETPFEPKPEKPEPPVVTPDDPEVIPLPAPALLLLGALAGLGLMRRRGC